MNNSLKARLLRSKKLKNEAKTAPKPEKSKQLAVKSAKGVISPKKTGRPLAITPEVEAMLESALQNGASIERACAYAEIVKQTFYNHFIEGSAFWTRMSKALEFANLSATKLVIDDITTKKNVETAKWWLQRKLPNEFGDKGGVNVGVQINQTLGKYAG